MAGRARTAVLRLMGVGLLLALGWLGYSLYQRVASTPPTAAALAHKEYDQWVAQYGDRWLGALMLGITAVEGEERSPGGSFGVVVLRCRVAPSGGIWHTYGSDLGGKQSIGGVLDPAALKRLNELLMKLPGDGTRLPPAGRRVMVEAIVAGCKMVRVYDRMGEPDEVLEVLRLSGSGIRAQVLSFKPQSAIDTHPSEGSGFQCVSPDGRQIISGYSGGPIRIWDPRTHAMLKENHRADVPLDCMTYSPDGSLAVVSNAIVSALLETKTWTCLRTFKEPFINGSSFGLSDPRFTPDGRYLVFEYGQPCLRIFDTHTWEQVPRLPDVPEDTLQYIEASSKRCAVIRSKSGGVRLWDLERHAVIAKLDNDTEIEEAAFAPDDSLVAVATAERGPRVWRTDSGVLVRELRVFELDNPVTVRRLVWSPDGRYLLGATRGEHLFVPPTMCIWNVQTGRHCGELAGVASEYNGLAFLAGGGELVAGCGDGRICFWDFAGVEKEIGTFESSWGRR